MTDIPAEQALPAPPKRTAYLVWGGLFGLLCLIMLSVGLETALHFLGSAIDGPFQLYNALRRIGAGQHGGVDFQFFHGIGLPYVHYLPYRLLGGNFLASELSRQLVTIVLYPAILVLFFRVYTRDWVRTLALSTLVMALSIGLRMTSMLVAVNSLLGVRSALPTILPVLMVLPIRPRFRAMVTGFTLGGALLLGTEQGIAVIMAFCLVSAVTVWRSAQRRDRITDAAISLGVAAVTILGVMVAIGGVAGMKGALMFNLKLVPMDQYWYFGAPPNFFLWSWTALPGIMASYPRIPISILFAVGLGAMQFRRLWREPDGEAGRRHAALAILAVYGLISCASLLGIFVAVYVQPCIRVVLLIVALELDRILPSRDVKLGRAPVLGVPRTLVMALVVAFVAMTVVVTSVVTALITTIPHIIADHVVRREGPVFGGIWPETITSGDRIMAERRAPNGAEPTIWSTYAGLLEAKHEIFHPSVDYVIHALGPEGRAKYVSDFQRLKPQLVQTVLPTYTQYEAWIEATSWDFYAELLRNYQVVGGSPWSIFWERTSAPTPAATPLWAASVAGATSVSIPSPPAGGGNQPNVVLMEVELEYRVHNPLRKLPLVGAMPRYLVRVSNSLNKHPVTLDPYVTTARFPVFALLGTNPLLNFATYSLLPGASFEVSNVRVSLPAVRQSNAGWLDNLIAQQTSRPTP